MAASVPRIVANESFLNQTSAISPTSIFTPDADGNYRISAYIDFPSNALGVGTEIDASITFTDDFGSRQFDIEGTPGGSGSAVRTARLTASNPVQVSTAYTGSPSPNNYNLFIVVEEL